uniref:Uncharacterized protein n=1 Tax=Meloidogyne enterolobii TaxID=390850 RepID=A0A6V7UX15_MELEN|nr:unnamed protein product [Meloidogyne enterolobii]
MGKGLKTCNKELVCVKLDNLYQAWLRELAVPGRNRAEILKWPKMCPRFENLEAINPIPRARLHFN